MYRKIKYLFATFSSVKIILHHSINIVDTVYKKDTVCISQKSDKYITPTKINLGNVSQQWKKLSIY